MVVSANDKSSAGIITLEVGQVIEETSASAAASASCRSTSGERSFTLESETLKNTANNGRMLFNFANLVPGAAHQNDLRHRERDR